MSDPAAGGAAFNPVVRTEDNPPAPEPDCPDGHDNDPADDGPTGKDEG